MQQINRLRQSRSRLLFNDAISTIKQEHREQVQRVKELTNEDIVVQPRFVTQSLFDRYVAYVREHTTELSCHHHKFYWHLCMGCMRGRKQADAYLRYYQERIQKVLATMEVK